MFKEVVGIIFVAYFHLAVCRSPPNLSFCKTVDHLFDHHKTGKYLKSACTVDAALNYEDAENFCRSMKMELFVINNDVVESTFRDALTKKWTGNSVWINGRVRHPNNWFSYTRSGPYQLFNGIKWVLNVEPNLSCLLFSEIEGSFKASSKECTFANTVLSCEFFKKPILDTASCRKRDHIDGNELYLKSACIVGTSRNYEDSERHCISKGMTLFNINNAAVQTALFNFTSKIISQGTLWINGRRDIASGKWFAYTPSKVEVSNEIDWYRSGEDGRKTGDCLSWTGKTGRYQAKGGKCETEQTWSVCEHH